MSQVHGFSPVECEGAKIMILGSMPGIESLKAQQYYGNKRNAFWWLMENLLAIDSKLPYPERIKKLQKNKIMLWDVFASCERVGSLDSKIESASIEVNDFRKLLTERPSISAVFFNGKTVASFFEKHVIRPGKLDGLSVEMHILPSTSPANARMTKEQKLQHWRQIVGYLSQ